MSISGVLNRLSNYHTHLAKHDFLQLRFDYLIPHPTLICPKTITLFFVYELIYVIYLTRLKVFANYLHLLYSNLLIIRYKLYLWYSLLNGKKYTWDTFGNGNFPGNNFLITANEIISCSGKSRNANQYQAYQHSWYL